MNHHLNKGEVAPQCMAGVTYSRRERRHSLFHIRRWRTRTDTTNSAGFSLLEVVVATAILTACIFPVLLSRNSAVTRAVNTSFLRTARMLACQKMEQVILAEDSELIAEELGEFGGSIEGYEAFYWSVEEEEVSLSTQEEIDAGEAEVLIRRIRLTITYPVEGKEEQTDEFSLVTVLPSQQEEGDGE